MDRQKEQSVESVSVDELRKDLRVAKEKLRENAKGLSLKKGLAEHPYAALGAAFATGAVLGVSGHAQTEIAKMAVEVIGKELINRMYE